MLDTNIWLAAFGQLLFSLSLGWGVITAYSSYLPEDSNLVKNGFIVVASNCGFELFTAVGVFSILGFMSLSQGLPLDHTVTQGTGLIFVAFPTVLNIMGDFAYILGPLFFLCVFFAGITTTISFLEPLSLAITRKFKIRRKKVTTLLCVCGFLISLLFATGAGNYLLSIFDSFLNQFAILIGIISECIVFSWFYKLDELLNILKFKSDLIRKTWKLFIKFIIPVILVFVWINGIYSLIYSEDILMVLIQLIIAIFLIIIPAILTYLPKSNKKLESNC